MTRKPLWVVLLLILPAVSLVLGDNGPMHQKFWPRPFPLGISGSNTHDIHTTNSGEFCCGGTLGAEVKDAKGNIYVLSNNHVLARDNRAPLGETVMQPGLIDTNCGVPQADVIGRLARVIRFQFNNRNNVVDAALAIVSPGTVAANGRILDIGAPGPPIQAGLRMGVKKSGRSSGKTIGSIQALNVTVLVKIPSACNSSTTTNVRFVNQIFIHKGAVPFIKPGDSGSLLVVNKLTCPRTVGLIFAGDDQGDGMANPIQAVLQALRVSLVGCGNLASAAMDDTSFTLSDPRLIGAAAVQARHEEELFKIPGVVGVGIGAVENTDLPAVVVFVQNGPLAAETSLAVPSTLEYLPVRQIVTSGFTAF